MKKLFKIFMIVGFAVFFTVSCEVERFPYNAIEQTEAFRTMTDAETIRNGMYAQLKSRVYGLFMFSTDVQADLLNASLDFGNRNGAPHRWEPLLSTDYTIRDVWRLYYSALTNVNNVVENMELVETDNDEDLALLRQYTGEAHLLRAYYNYMLVIRWGYPYNASTASTDLGIPLILKYNPALKPSRATVEQTYEQIMTDLAEAKTRLPNGGPNTEFATRDAALALEARVKLQMADYPGVVSAAEELINSGRYALETTEAGLQNKWVNDQSSEIIFHAFVARPDELKSGVGVNGIYLGYQPGAEGEKYTPDFVPQQWVVDMYEDDDFRKSVFLDQKHLRIQGFEYEDIWLINKYPGNPEMFTNVTNYQHKPKVFHISETYMNLIEALLQTNETEALNRLNEIRQARGLEALSGLTGNDLVEAYRAERLRELLAEGYRLNDLMRWGLGVERREPQNMDIIVTGSTYNNLVIPAGHFKFIWGIPANDMTTNDNMVQNPGW
jgi:starch-binding outer membrane protein, SusD/RagB family